MSNQTPYEILGLTEIATKDEIIKAYHRLARLYHPDKNPNSDTRDKFEEISNAYRLLTEERENIDNNHMVIRAISEGKPLAIDSNIDESILKEKITHYFSENLNLNKDVKLVIDDLSVNKLLDIFVSFKKNLLVKNPAADYEDQYAHLDTEAIKSLIETANKNYDNPELLVQEQAFLWEAKQVGKAPIYLLGTMHLLNQDPADIFGDLVARIMDDVDKVFCEIDTSSALEEIEIESSGVVLYSFEKMIENIARRARKKLGVLENIAVRQQMYPADLLEIIERIFQEALSGSKEYYRELTNSFLNVLAPFDPENHPAHCVFEILLTLRNKLWMLTLLDNSNVKTPILVACGANHNIGKFGLPNLLANEGYTLTPLIKKAPLPKSVILRSLVFSNSESTTFLPEKLEIESTEKNAPSVTKKEQLKAIKCKEDPISPSENAKLKSR